MNYLSSRNEHNDNEMQTSVLRYYKMLEENLTAYFDVFEFEYIIDFFLTDFDYKSALDAITRAIKMHPSAFELLYKKAFIYIEYDKPTRAIEIIEKVEKIDNDIFLANFLKGLAYIKFKNIKQAEKYLKTAISETKTPKEQYETFYQIGFAFLQKNEYITALKYYENAYKLAPSNDELIYDMAYCYEKTDENYKSIEFYKYYLAENPFDEMAWYNLGITYEKTHEYESSVEAYQYAIAIEPKYSSAYFNLANALAQNEKYEKAIACYLDFLELEPDDALANCYIADCYQKIEQNDKALFYYYQSIQNNPEIADTWYGIAIVLQKFEELKSAILFAENAITLNNENPDFYALLAELYLEINNKKKAITTYKKLIKEAPYDFNAWIAYAAVYEEDNLSKAIQILKEAYKYNNDNPEINFTLATYLLNNDKLDEALFHLNIGLEENNEIVTQFFKYIPDARRNKDVDNLLAKYQAMNIH